MRLIKSILLAFFLFIFSGYGEPTIDATTDETLKISIQDVSKPLSKDEKAEFETAIKIITYQSLDIKSMMAKAFMSSFKGTEATSIDEEKMLEDIRNSIHG